MQAYRSWREKFTRRHLKDVYENKIKKKPSVGMDKVSPRKFDDTLDDNVNVILRKVKKGTYYFTRYKMKLASKGPGKKPRIISILTMRDKMVASILNEILVDVYEEVAKTPLLQMVIADLTKNKEKYDSFIKLDMSGFYSTICHEKLLAILNKKIRKKEIMKLIKNAIKTETIPYPVLSKNEKKERNIGVPEGLPISNSLANIYMTQTSQL